MVKHLFSEHRYRATMDFISAAILLLDNSRTVTTENALMIQQIEDPGDVDDAEIADSSDETSTPSREEGGEAELVRSADVLPSLLHLLPLPERPLFPAQVAAAGDAGLCRRHGGAVGAHPPKLPRRAQCRRGRSTGRAARSSHSSDCEVGERRFQNRNPIASPDRSARSDRTVPVSPSGSRKRARTASCQGWSVTVSITSPSRT